MDKSTPSPTTELRRLRQRSGRSLRSTARAAGMDKAHLSRVERGLVRPSVPALTRILDALGAAEVAGILREQSDFIDQLVTPPEEGR